MQSFVGTCVYLFVKQFMSYTFEKTQFKRIHEIYVFEKTNRTCISSYQQLYLFFKNTVLIKVAIPSRKCNVKQFTKRKYTFEINKNIKYKY